MIYGESVKEKLQKELGNDFEVELAMRYKNPSLDEVCARMEKRDMRKLLFFLCFRNMLLQVRDLLLKKQ